MLKSIDLGHLYSGIYGLIRKLIGLNSQIRFYFNGQNKSSWLCQNNFDDTKIMVGEQPDLIVTPENYYSSQT